MLPEAVQREGDGKDQEIRHEVDAREHSPAAQQEDHRHDGEVERDRAAALPRDPPLESRWVGRGLAPRRAEIDREERGREVEQLVPGLVDSGGQVVPLRIGLRIAELGVMGQMPAGELQRRDPRGNGIEDRKGAFGRRPRTVEDGAVNDLVQEDGEVEDRPSGHQRRRNPDPRLRKHPRGPRRDSEDQELPGGDREVPRGVLAVELLQDVARDLLRQAVTQLPGDFGPVVLAAGRRVLLRTRGSGSGGRGGGAHGSIRVKTSERRLLFCRKRQSPRKTRAIAK